MEAKAKGYKGHRAGSIIEKAHKLIDESPKAERKVLVPKLVKLGLKESTAGNWISFYRRTTAAKPKTAKTAAAKKTVIKVKPKTPAIKKKIVAPAPTISKKAEQPAASPAA
mgnify:CR=1 FL=1